MKYQNFTIHNVFITIVLIHLLACSTERTDVQLANLFSDNMVLQQNSANPIWGNATAGSELKVTTSWGEEVAVTASNDEKWMTKINTPEANGKSQTITFETHDTTIVLNNVLAGEVWLCSGQSNMEMPLKGWLPRDPLDNSEEEIANANYSAIRMFTVKRNKSFSPLGDVDGAWEVCTPKNAPEFSAVAYFFGRKLHNELGVPIGLIHSSWGGSPAQSWVEADFIEKVEGYESVKEQLAKAADKTSPYNRWIATMKKIGQDEFIGKENFKLEDQEFSNYKDIDYDDSSWSVVSASTMDSVFQKDDFNGMAWFRQVFSFEGDVQSSEYQLFLGQVKDLNATFINGTLVGRTERWGDHRKDQIFNIPAGILKKGKNILAVRVIDNWDTGGLYSNPSIQDMHGQTIVGLNNSWTYKHSAILIDGDNYILPNGYTSRVNPESGTLSLIPHSPTVLYNAMIAPLIPFSIKGAIWYQGESNRDKPTQYHTLFPAVFNSWRSNWGIGDFPFYYVQLASFTYNSDKVAELREAQLETLKEKNVGMAVTMDIGSLTTIHPPNKQDVGKRLALWALAKDYSKEEMVYSGPLFKSVDFKDDKAVVSFDHIGEGLYSPDIEVSHFELAGHDLIFHPASAFIKDNKVIAQSSNVQKPTIVRYGWSATAMPNLFNKEGLPASPFRSSKRIHLGPEEVYPSQNVEIKYHSDWTKDHYPSRIDEFRKDPLNYGDIVFLGNSITESGRDWGQKLGLKNVKNRGISGDVTDGVLKRLDEITHFKAKAVFILIGINDLSNLYYQKKIPSAEYVGNNILKITESIKNESPKTQIYLQTVLPNANEEMRESINIVNTIIKSNEQKGRYKVIDLHKKFKGEDGLMKSELTTDGVHLNKTGYDLWVSELKLFIN